MLNASIHELLGEMIALKSSSVPGIRYCAIELNMLYLEIQ